MALSEAQRAVEDEEVPIGSVVVTREGRLIAKAHNQTRRLSDPTAHAEILAITQAANALQSERLTDTSLYVTIEPCSMCAGAIIQSRISRLVFGARDPKAGACGSVFNLPDERRLNHRVEVVGGLMEQESQDLMQAFFRGLRENLDAPGLSR